MGKPITVGNYRGLKNEETILVNGIVWMKEKGLNTDCLEEELMFLRNKIECVEAGIHSAITKKNGKAIATDIATA